MHTTSKPRLYMSVVIHEPDRMMKSRPRPRLRRGIEEARSREYK